VTVYDYCHVGHARVCVVFDVVQRVIRKLGHDLLYVRNFTDVDDKIIKRAAERGEPIGELTERFIQAFYQDMDALDCQRPDIEPRVSDHIPEIIAMVEQIVARGHGYAVDGEGEGKDVYFSVRSLPTYGALSGRKQEDNTDGASDRVGFDERKQDQADFALWKGVKAGEPSWPSPWGPGRPGWHIECSAMACKHLGTTFDIHCGGRDLIFPHHENEIAQAEAASGEPFVRHWMHNGFVNIDSEKMSKSLGNFFTVRDVLARFHPQVLRFFLLTTHYGHPINFSDHQLEETTRRVLAIYEKLAAADAVLETRGVAMEGPEPAVTIEARNELMAALSDDFNSARALAALSEPVRVLGAALLKPKKNLEKIRATRAFFRDAAEVLGLFQHPPAEVVEAIVEGLRERLLPAGSEGRLTVERLVQERTAARAARDWPLSDALRDELQAMGVEVRDGAGGTVWRPQIGDSA
jgi:cysteinyl-tRNA synthetase